MNRWSPDFPGRLVDFPDYCRMVERTMEKRSGSVFAYEPMWVDGEGRIYPSNTLVIAEWLDGSGAFDVLENGTWTPNGVEGLRNEMQLRTIHNASHFMAEHVIRQNARKERDRIARRADQRARRRDLGMHILKKDAHSVNGRRMVRETN